MSSDKEKGDTSQQSENAEQHHENPKNFLYSRVAQKIHEAGPLARACRFSFALVVGSRFCTFGIFYMFTGVSSHG
jgi:hypothetical protein